MKFDRLALWLPVIVPVVFLATLLAIMLLPGGETGDPVDRDLLTRRLVEAAVAYEPGGDLE